MRIILTFLTFIACLVMPPAAYSQTAEALQDIYNALSDLDEIDEEGWNDAYEILSTLAETPQNINEATQEDLNQIPLLTQEQAAAILHYRSLYGDLHSMSELPLITALDRPRQILLNCIFYAKPTKDNGHTAIITPNDSVARTYRYAKDNNGQALVMSMNIPLYEREGYNDGSYHGYQFSHTLRYTLHKRHTQVAFTAAQDAGEPFFAGTNKKGWDFYTGFVRLKNMRWLKNMVIGHYQMSMGMGLLINNNFQLSRASMAITPPNISTTLRGHSSRMESNYLQGIAATVALPHTPMTLTAFASYRPLDATMSKGDSPTVTTILTTGYHRTDSEIARRGTTRQTVVGASLELTAAPFRLALNVLYVSMRDSLLPNTSQKYRMYYPKGKHFTSASLTYGYTSPRLQLSGETAVSQRATTPKEDTGGMALATSNNIYWKPSTGWTMFALQRFYSYRFQSLLGKSYGQTIQNETGVSLGAMTSAIRHLTLSSYIDYAYHPWHRYGYAGPSESIDGYVVGTYTANPFVVSMRYRYRSQHLTDTDEGGTTQHTLRGTMKYTHGKFSLMTQAQATYVSTVSKFGALLCQAVGYKFSGIQLWGSLAYFKTDDYKSRLYLTDRALTYGSTSAMVYGEGLRANIIGEASITKSLMLSLRCGMLHYFDRDKISSSYQAIDSSTQTDIQVQVAWKF